MRKQKIKDIYVYRKKKWLKGVPNWRYLWVRFWKTLLQLRLWRLLFFSMNSVFLLKFYVQNSYWRFLSKKKNSYWRWPMKIDWWLCSCQLHGIRKCTMFGNHASVAALWQVWDLLLLSSKLYNQVLKLQSSTHPYSRNSLLHLLQKIGQKMWSRNSHFSVQQFVLK